MVARGLLGDTAIPGALGDAAVEREARERIARAKVAAGFGTRERFGRPRVIDFSQYRPRGHYTEKLAPYLRAAMWRSRLELNIVSRSSRSSAPGDAPRGSRISARPAPPASSATRSAIGIRARRQRR